MASTPAHFSDARREVLAKRNSLSLLAHDIYETPQSAGEQNLLKTGDLQRWVIYIYIYIYILYTHTHAHIYTHTYIYVYILYLYYCVILDSFCANVTATLFMIILMVLIIRNMKLLYISVFSMHIAVARGKVNKLKLYYDQRSHFFSIF